MDPDVAARTLRLLTLLQSRPAWSGDDLATALEASPRTLRRDLARLTALGYTVLSRPGPGGHYRLGAGTRLPPLVFDDDEVVALVAGLRMAQQGLAGEAATRALVKLRQVLPRRLARVAGDVAEHSESLQPADPWPDRAADALRPLTAAASADREVDFSYVDQHGTTSRRRTDSVRCLFARGRWAVLAYDLDRDDWRLFLLERVRDVVAGEVSTRRAPPADDLAEWLATDFGRVGPAVTPGSPRPSTSRRRPGSAPRRQRRSWR